MTNNKHALLLSGERTLFTVRAAAAALDCTNHVLFVIELFSSEMTSPGPLSDRVTHSLEDPSSRETQVVCSFFK